MATMPYKCVRCGNEFTTNSYMRAHIRKKTKCSPTLSDVDISTLDIKLFNTGEQLIASLMNKPTVVPTVLSQPISPIAELDNTTVLISEVVSVAEIAPVTEVPEIVTVESVYEISTIASEESEESDDEVKEVKEVKDRTEIENLLLRGCAPPIRPVCPNLLDTHDLVINILMKNKLVNEISDEMSVLIRYMIMGKQDTVCEYRELLERAGALSTHN